METIYFNGTPCHTYGLPPKTEEKAPEFKLTTVDLNTVTNESYPGKKIVLNVFPSLDTPVCAASVRKFNKMASEVGNTVVLCVSMDLPFAAARFCTLEGLNDVVAASAFRSPEFAEKYGVGIVDGPLAGLLARSVFVIDENGKLIYEQIVDEITNEPDYAGALSVLK